MTSFKLYFDDNNIRRLRTLVLPNLEEFMDLLERTYHEYDRGGCYVIKYIDFDGDKITVSSELEWEEMIQNFNLRREKVFKIIIEKSALNDEILNPFTLYSSANSTSSNPFIPTTSIPSTPVPSPTLIDSSSSTESPSSSLVSIPPPPSVTAPSDPSPSFFELLHQKTSSWANSLDRNVIQRGKAYFLSLLQHIPNNKMALYYLACAESLKGNISESLEALNESILLGYDNLEQMMNDKDLDNIRNTEEFSILVRNIENALANKFMNNVQEKVSLNDEPIILKYDNSFIDSLCIGESIDLSKNDESLYHLRLKWANEINMIKDMGFLGDDEVFSLLLEQHSGNLDDVLKILSQN